MARRTQRHFTDSDKEALLKELKEWRERCIEVSTNAPINSPAYVAVAHVLSAIHRAGFELTGNETYFLPPRHVAHE